MFPKPFLERYRQAVLDDRAGPLLAEAIDGVKGLRGYAVGGEHYKRVPRGFDPNHPRADLLRFNTLHLSSPEIPVSVLKKPDLVDACYQHGLNMAPLHHWLVQLSRQ